MAQVNIATAYSDRIQGDKVENIEKAISCYSRALEIYTKNDNPQDWAMTQNNLGIAYGERVRGNKDVNLEKSISAYLRSLEIYNYTAFPQQWAGVQNNLGKAYFHRVEGDKAENLEKAVSAYSSALEVYTEDAFPLLHAKTLFNLGFVYQSIQSFENAYNCYKLGIRTIELIREKIVSGKEALEKFTDSWEKLYSNMAEVCIALGKEKEARNYLVSSKSPSYLEYFFKFFQPKG
jgi:tetratricopeptide (TPR) repeat protein